MDNRIFIRILLSEVVMVLITGECVTIALTWSSRQAVDSQGKEKGFTSNLIPRRMEITEQFRLKGRGSHNPTLKVNREGCWMDTNNKPFP